MNRMVFQMFLEIVSPAGGPEPSGSIQSTMSEVGLELEGRAGECRRPPVPTAATICRSGSVRTGHRMRSWRIIV